MAEVAPSGKTKRLTLVSQQQRSLWQNLCPTPFFVFFCMSMRAFTFFDTVHGFPAVATVFCILTIIPRTLAFFDDIVSGRNKDLQWFSSCISVEIASGISTNMDHGLCWIINDYL